MAGARVDLPPEAPLAEYFRAVDKGAVWEFRCKRCNQGWELPKDRADHPGYLLRLLNHGRMHVALAADDGKGGRRGRR